MRILIVGAGPTGLTAAVELARRGVIADVIDKRESGSGFSRAVGIMPISQKTLAPSGATERLRAEGIRFEEVRAYNVAALAFTASLRLKDAPEDYILGLAQDRTETILRDTLAQYGGSIRFGVELTDLRQDGDQATGTTADGVESSYDYVIGADGIRSTVRGALGIDFPGFDLSETWSIADVEADDWPNITSFTMCRLADGKVAVVAPLEAKRFRVISNTPDALKALPLPMNVTKIHREGQFTISIRQVRDYVQGRVFLAGDAAHCHSPVGGRGMNLGIADAADLAHRLVEGDLDGYSAARHSAGAKAIAGSEAIRKAITSKNPLTRAATMILLRTANLFRPLQRVMARRILYG